MDTYAVVCRPPTNGSVPHAQALNVKKSASFKASADEVWHVINEFGSLQKWHPWFADSTLYTENGALHRLIVASDGAWVVESLEAYSWAGKSYTYSIVDGVFPIANYTATIAVSESGTGSTITWSSSFDAAGMADEEVVKLVIDAYQTGFKGIATITGE
ncbi:MAG: SRPBCC family protein [Alphaproteobacteria bacterium]|nr:SRPBCC family protein [Alphaproteobacteria bacterium]